MHISYLNDLIRVKKRSVEIIFIDINNRVEGCDAEILHYPTRLEMRGGTAIPHSESFARGGKLELQHAVLCDDDHRLAESSGLTTDEAKCRARFSAVRHTVCDRSGFPSACEFRTL